jgi:pSer/pThr/pTyr-binding forkhead associated (FHA) protein
MPPFPVPAAEAAYPAPGPAPPPSSFASGPAIPGRLTIQGTNVSLPFPQGKQQVFIGREDPVSGVFPEIDLTNYGGDEGGVSRSHARIFSHGNQVFIEDLNSVNYTFVNQQRLMPGQAHVLNSGDELRFGRVALNYYV